MNRVFYFSGHRLSVFHWSGNKFQGACSFEPDADGLAKFRAYLDSTEKSPARLLVDVIEEDFRVDSAPHVFGKDRKAVISRLLDRYYRSSGQYVYSEVIGRAKTGRRDDRVLIGGITNPRLIGVWKDIIDDCRIPLTGIWSLPLVSKNLLPLLGEKRSAVLLVSQQVNSNLRQTFFRDGKMLSSRQSVINQDVNDISKIGKFAVPEVKRTIAFLRNQRLIENNEIVHIHVIGSEGQTDSLQNEFITDDLNDVVIHKLSDLKKKAHIEGLTGKFSDGLMTWLCTRQLAFQAHYGEVKEYSQYYHLLAAKALKGASILLVLSAMLITESNLSSAIEHNRSIELLGEQADEYKKIYKSRFEGEESVYDRARIMSATVGLAERMTRHAETSPLDFMIKLSAILSESSLNVESIDKIEWSLEQYKIQGDEKVVYESGVDVTIEDPVQHIGVVHGRIDVSDKNYRVSVAQVNKIISALKKHERIEQVVAIEMPVEVRPEKTFTDESGLNVQSSARKEKGRFTLQIVMRAVDHE